MTAMKEVSLGETLHVTILIDSHGVINPNTLVHPEAFPNTTIDLVAMKPVLCSFGDFMLSLDIDTYIKELYRNNTIIHPKSLDSIVNTLNEFQNGILKGNVDRYGRAFSTGTGPLLMAETDSFLVYKNWPKQKGETNILRANKSYTALEEKPAFSDTIDYFKSLGATVGLPFVRYYSRSYPGGEMLTASDGLTNGITLDNIIKIVLSLVRDSESNVKLTIIDTSCSYSDPLQPTVQLGGKYKLNRRVKKSRKSRKSRN